MEHKSLTSTDLDFISDDIPVGTPFTALSLQDLHSSTAKTSSPSPASIAVYQNPYQWYQAAKLESWYSDKASTRRSPAGHGIGALGTGATQSDVALLMQLNQELNEALEMQSKQHSYEIDLLNSIVLEYRRKEKEAEEIGQQGQNKDRKHRMKSTSPISQSALGRSSPLNASPVLDVNNNPTPALAPTSSPMPLPEDPKELELAMPYLHHIESLELVNKETIQKLQKLGNIMVEKDEVISTLRRKAQEERREENEKEEKRRVDQILHLESQIESLDRQNKVLSDEAQSFKTKYEDVYNTQRALENESSELETSLRNDLQDYETEYETLAVLKDELMEKKGRAR